MNIQGITSPLTTDLLIEPKRKSLFLSYKCKVSSNAEASPSILDCSPQVSAQPGRGVSPALTSPPSAAIKQLHHYGLHDHHHHNHHHHHHHHYDHHDRNNHCHDHHDCDHHHDNHPLLGGPCYQIFRQFSLVKVTIAL